jgi:hypothetical protein
VETSVTMLCAEPLGCPISISESLSQEPSPPGFTFLGQQINIDAPPATANDPIELVFVVDASLIDRDLVPPLSNFYIFKDGELVLDCTHPLGRAQPDPCVWSRRYLGADIEIVVLTSSASAWNFGVPESLGIAIDVRPDDYPNMINPYRKGKLPVAVITGDGFDAATVDPHTILFGPTGVEAAADHWAWKDVDSDGDDDLILKFNTTDLGLWCSEQPISVRLTGESLTGERIHGSDKVVTVGCE